MFDKKLTKKYHLYSYIGDTKVLRYANQCMGRFLTKDEIYIIYCSLQRKSLTDVMSSLRDDTYTISLVNGLINSKVIRDDNGILKCRYYPNESIPNTFSTPITSDNHKSAIKAILDYYMQRDGNFNRLSEDLYTLSDEKLMEITDEEFQKYYKNTITL